MLDSSELSHQKLFLGMVEALGEPSKVYKLCMGGQELKTFPVEATDCENLQELNISQNYFETLPDAFCKLINLTELKMGTNSFKSLPQCFGEFKHLQYLDISTNPSLKWNEVIIEICKIKSLEYLDLSYNEINTIPACLYTLKNLQNLYLSGNKLTKKQIEELQSKLPNTIIHND